MSAQLLIITGLCASYDGVQVLHDLSLTVAAGDIVAVTGPNGAGKTTLVRALMGLVPDTNGQICLDGQDLAGLSPERRVRAGLGWVPQGRAIFPSLSVRENILVAQRAGPWTLKRLETLFPFLAERSYQPGSQLSGGEQQLLAFARALVTNPRLLVLDEPFEGLSLHRQEACVALLRDLRAEGTMGVLITGQGEETGPLASLADDILPLDGGRIAPVSMDL